MEKYIGTVTIDLREYQELIKLRDEIEQKHILKIYDAFFDYTATYYVVERDDLINTIKKNNDNQLEEIRRLKNQVKMLLEKPVKQPWYKRLC